jgi:hypothetical protein
LLCPRDSYQIIWVEETAVFDGYRAVLGLDYNNDELQLRAEGYLGKAFQDLLDIPYYADLWADSSSTAKIAEAPYEDLEMQAFIVQAGYKFALGRESSQYLQPYVQYQWWDQAANLDGEYQSAYLTVGANLGLIPGNARLKVDYQTCVKFAEDGGIPGYSEEQQADRLIVRLQVEC